MPVRNDILACTLITPLTLVITYVCLLSSQYYSQIKFNNEPSARWTSFSLLCMVGIMFIGYYTWVYAVIRMHGRRWYYWWQRTCTVRLRLPAERSNRITGVSVAIVNERVTQSVPENAQESVPQITLENSPQILPRIVSANVPETLLEADITIELCETSSSIDQLLDEILGTQNTDEETIV